MAIQKQYKEFYDEEGNYIVGSRENKIERLKDEIRATDYIAIKASEGIDCSEYGDWRAERAMLRIEINELEKLNLV